MPEEYTSEVLSFYYTESFWELHDPSKSKKLDSIKLKLLDWAKSSKAIKESPLYKYPFPCA